MQAISEAHVRAFVEQRFYGGIPYRLIRSELEESLGVHMSKKQFELKLHKWQLRRHLRRDDDANIRRAIELIRDVYTRGPFRNSGYRTVALYLKLAHHVYIPQHLVRVIMNQLNPQGRLERMRRRLHRRTYRSPGPFHAWHLDGNDKCKEFGLPIHACIDGASRFVLYCNILPSNNDPCQVVLPFLETVRRFGRVPSVAIGDFGTELVHVADAQRFLRWEGIDRLAGMESFRQQKSVFNQRIESWWLDMRQMQVSWWIDELSDLFGDVHVNLDDDMERALYLHVVVPLFQRSLDEFVIFWNFHRIRKQGDIPGGRPHTSFHHPSAVGLSRRGFEVDEEALAFLEAKYSSMPIAPFYDPSLEPEVSARLEALLLVHGEPEVTVDNFRALVRTLIIDERQAKLAGLIAAPA